MPIRVFLPSRLRYAARALANNPVFTASTVVSLGLALALNTTMFALIDGLRHPYSPYAEAERVVTVSFRGSEKSSPVPPAERFTAVRDGSTMYEAIASVTRMFVVLRTASTAENQALAAASPELFDVIRARPMHGRVFEARATGAQEAVISFRLWMRVFNGRPLESGLRVQLGDATYAVVGVMPRAVHFPWGTDVWISTEGLAAQPTADRSWPYAVLRLKKGVTTEMARSELAHVATRLTNAYSLRAPIFVRVMPLESPVSRREVLPWYFRAAVVVVLLIAGANLGTMMLARGVARRRETAIRIALGASRRAIMSQVLAESGLIVLAGAACGALLTLWALHVLPHVMAPLDPEIADLQVIPSWRVFALMLAINVAVLIGSSLAPALLAARTDPNQPIKEGSGASTGRTRDRYNLLVIGEVALSTALLMSCVLFVIYLLHLKAFDFQYAAKRLIVANIHVRDVDVRDAGAVEQFYYELVGRAKRLPGSRLAATSYFERTRGGAVYAEGGAAGEQAMIIQGYTVVTSDYLRTIGMPVIDGRDFEMGDRRSANGAVIVDENAAKRLWPNLQSPVGHMIKLGPLSASSPWVRVVGVSRAVDLRPRREGSLPPEPTIYWVKEHDVARQRDLVVQGDGTGGVSRLTALSLALQRDIESAGPRMSLPEVRPWLASYNAETQATQHLASILGAFAAFGLALCAVGVYGVIAYSVRRRLREFAIRIALGARGGDVARVVVRDIAVTILGGIAVGAFVALWLTREISGALVTMRFADVTALVAAEVVLLVVATAACAGPVRQAAAVDPAEALRSS